MAHVEFPCGVCLKEVSSRHHGVQCRDKCLRWFHKDCVKISTADYARLSSDDKIIWKCLRADCMKKDELSVDVAQEIRKLASVVMGLADKVEGMRKTDLAEIKNDVRAVNSKLESIENRISDSEKLIANLEGRVMVLESNSTLGAGTLHEDVIGEIEDRSKRSRNLILHNLPESKKGDVPAKISHDKDLVRELLEKMNLTSSINVECIKLYRIGKPGGKNARPLRVILKSLDDVKLFFDKFSTDAVRSFNPAFSNLGVSRDRTERERLHLMRLKEELEKRTNDGETDLTIKYRNGVPVILKYKKN
jgi:hypothetical protein